jgi:tellurite methyltransferase
MMRVADDGGTAPARLSIRRAASRTARIFCLMLKTIVGFHQDEEGVWVADLACGHPQHVRHAPPFQNRAWVLDEAGRQAKLGSELDCLYCNMASLPTALTAYKRTKSFSESSVPGGLLQDHRTKSGVWAQIVVEEGKLEYTCERGTFVLRPGIVGVVEPELPHHVRPLGAVLFHVVFLVSQPLAPA